MMAKCSAWRGCVTLAAAVVEEAFGDAAHTVTGHFAHTTENALQCTYTCTIEVLASCCAGGYE